MTSTQTLPNFIEPMLAQTGDPFDSDEHIFEIKWDGLRATAYIENDGYRILNRRGTDVTNRYPEFASFASLPPGCVLDGEIVVLNRDGKPSFHEVMTRESGGSQLKVNSLARSTPANFIAFDQLYCSYESIIRNPLLERRELLTATLSHGDCDRIAQSEGVIGPGKAFFQEVIGRDLEGIVAKRLSARYFPGTRSDAWLKMRKRSTILCAIVGYIPDGNDFESLILAAEEEGELRYVGRVGNGFDAVRRRRINTLLKANAAPQPLIPCDLKGVWLRAGLYCSVRFLEWSHNRELREPVFEHLISDEGVAL